MEDKGLQYMYDINVVVCVMSCIATSMSLQFTMPMVTLVKSMYWKTMVDSGCDHREGILESLGLNLYEILAVALKS